ncbi:MAG: phytanoyl-CoA dioxygenase family protein [Burkholderiales bacterium]
MGAMRRYALYETQPMVNALEAEGYAFVPGVLSAQQCSAAREMIDALEPIAWDEVDGGAVRHGAARFMDRYLCVFNRDPYWLQFIDRPGLIDLAQAALGPDCHLIGMTAWRSHPGYKAEPFHVDYLPFASGESGLLGAGRMPMFILTLHLYLSEITSDHAPTRVIPGSHLAGRPPRELETQWQTRGPQVVLAGAGDALAFRSDVWHAGSDNRTASDVRYLLQVHYGRREMAQHFSPYMSWRFNPAVLAAASPRQWRLLGDHDPGAYD